MSKILDFSSFWPVAHRHSHITLFIGPRCGISYIIIRTLSGASTQLVNLVCVKWLSLFGWKSGWLMGGGGHQGARVHGLKKFMMVYEKKLHTSGWAHTCRCLRSKVIHNIHTAAVAGRGANLCVSSTARENRTLLRTPSLLGRIRWL